METYTFVNIFETKGLEYLLLICFLVLFVLLARATELGLVSGEQRKAVLSPLMGYAAATVGLLLYPLSTVAFTDARGFEPEMAESWRRVFTVLWMLLSAGGSGAAK